MTYDSRPETYQHISAVRGLLLMCAANLMARAHVHDASKLEDPELSTFNRSTERLKTLTYGSDEYKAALADMGPALAHHYSVNDHHPEYFAKDARDGLAEGVRGMHLLQLLEMLCDWRAACKRHPNGDVRASLEINAARFNIHPDLVQILANTLDELDTLERFGLTS